MKEKSKVEFGSIQIHKKVIEDIVHTAMSDVDGISLIEGDWTISLMELFGKKHRPGIIVTVGRDNQVLIEVKVIIRYGKNIPEVARHVQDVIRNVIDKTVDVNLKEVNVNIQGIERGE